MDRPKNPYVAGPPLRGEMGFFGRQDVLNWVAKELCNPLTNALVLFGQRRIGKTTLLLQLQRTLPPDTFLPVHFDLQDQARRPLGQVLADLADAIADRAYLELLNSKDFDDEGRFFRRTFLPQLCQALGENRRPVFLLDEFEVLDQAAQGELPETVAAKSLLPLIRHVMTEEPHLAFVFAVGRRAEDLSIDFKSTFKASLAREIWVLDRESAEALVRQAEANGTLRFTDQAVARILSLTSGHPYLTQLLCQRIWERAYSSTQTEPPFVGAPEVEAAIPDAMEVGGQALAWLWDGLSPAEKIYAAALAETADEGEIISEDRVIQVLAAQGPRLRIREVELAPDSLVKRKVLDVAEDGGYHFAVELFRRWVHKNKPLRDVKDEVDRMEPVAEQFFGVGQSYFHQRQWENAIDYFQRALTRNPVHFRAQLYLGEALLELGKFDDAVAELERAYKLDQEEAHFALLRALVTQAQVQEKAGNEEGAWFACERALQVSPHEQVAKEIEARIWIRRGDTALERKDLDTALTAYLQADAQEKVEEVEKLRRWRPQSVLDDKYKIIGLLAATGFCEIYKAQDLQPPRDIVVVKRLRPGKLRDSSACVRFEREVAVLRRIHHQFLLPINDTKITDHEYYFVTDFADKGNLKDYLETQPNHKLNPIEALEIATAVCQGLDAVHRRGIIHRDIKPGNILLFSQPGGGIAPKLADLGSARIPKGWSDIQLNETLGVRFTPLYAAPEQLTPLYASPSQPDTNLISNRSDLYSWGLVFFEMLTGESPGGSLRDPATFVVPDEISMSFLAERSVPHQLAEVLHKVLYKDPQLRSRSTGEVLETLRSIRIPVVPDISQHLTAGESQVRAREWQAARAEFERGMALCKWYGDLDQLPDEVGELANKLQAGHFCALAMLHLAERQWKAAIEALEQLQALDPNYSCIDIDSQLELAQSEEQFESQYRLILKLKGQGDWKEVLRLGKDLIAKSQRGIR